MSHYIRTIKKYQYVSTKKKSKTYENLLLLIRSFKFKLDKKKLNDLYVLVFTKSMWGKRETKWIFVSDC